MAILKPIGRTSTACAPAHLAESAVAGDVLTLGDIALGGSTVLVARTSCGFQSPSFVAAGASSLPDLQPISSTMLDLGATTRLGTTDARVSKVPNLGIVGKASVVASASHVDVVAFKASLHWRAPSTGRSTGSLKLQDASPMNVIKSLR